MARRKKDDKAGGAILVILGVIVWGIYVAVRALINVNEKFIDFVSTPVGIIALFFGLLFMAKRKLTSDWPLGGYCAGPEGVSLRMRRIIERSSMESPNARKQKTSY